MNVRNDSLSKGVVVIVLLVLVAAGAVLRFSRMEAQSLAHDELATWDITNHTLGQTMKIIETIDVHPPAYYLVIFFSRKLLGDSGAALRIPSAVFGTLCIPVIFLLGSRLYDKRIGLLSAALMAVLNYPLYYSQEARQYTMLLLFTALATYYWIRMLQSLRDRTHFRSSAIVFYILSSIISCYTDQEGVYLVFLQGLFALAYSLRWKRFLPVLLQYVVICLAYIPWVVPLLNQMRNPSYYWIERPDLAYFPKWIGYLFNGVSDQRVAFVVVLAGVLLLYLYFIFSWVRNVQKARVRGTRRPISVLLVDSDVIVLLWLVVPFVGLYIISVLFHPVLIYRALIISLPAAYLLLSRAVFSLPFRKYGRGAFALAVVAFFVADLFVVVQYYGKPHKEQYREMVKFVLEETPRYPNALIVSNEGRYLDYYFEHLGFKKTVNVDLWYPDSIGRSIETIRKDRPSYIWYLNAHDPPNQRFMQFLLNEFTPVLFRRFYGPKGDIMFVVLLSDPHDKTAER